MSNDLPQFTREEMVILSITAGTNIADLNSEEFTEINALYGMYVATASDKEGQESMIRSFHPHISKVLPTVESMIEKYKKISAEMNLDYS